MSYIKIKFLCCILLLSLFSLTNAKPSIDLKEKLQRLLEDPEHDDQKNEIFKTRQTQGMLLKGRGEHSRLIDTSSEERLYEMLSKKEKISETVLHSDEEAPPMSKEEAIAEIATSTLPPAPALGSPVATTTTGHRSLPIIGGFSSFISRLINIWTKA